MYGQIHCVIRELVQTKFGNEAWEEILRKSKLDEHSSFLVFTRYDDCSTFSLVGAVSETLAVPVETVLEIFGEFFFDYCLRHGYDKMLRTLGSDMKSFIQNLDSLHSLLALSYKGISAPSFRCEDGPDGVLILHYYSGRPGLYPIVKGVLKAVARDLFDQSVEMTIIEQNDEDIGCNQSQEHTAFRVLLRTENKSNIKAPSEVSITPIRGLVEFKPEKVLLRAADFCSAFPYHIIFDRELKIRQCGDLVQKHCNIAIVEGMHLTSAFNIVHPKMVVSIENIRKFINAVFLIAISRNENGKKTFLLKGQMVWLSNTQNMIFIGSPRLTSLNELIEMNVYLADIPLYDVTRELVLLNQQRIAEIDIAKRLDETTAELKRTSQALEEEKSKTETLLHQMLPRKVATALTHGQKVEAEKFDQVTVLFSDIVTFTNIASACSPMDIVNMLNEMYQRFDERTSQHNVYKVETIGDAYMIVSGVPERTTNHAEPVANFALDMVEDAGLVRSPATGLPLQIRVGVHTGPVVAGVVGVKMPRYCLFGDTVNTASRMESHGAPGRIHMSPTAYHALRGSGYTFKQRGQMEVKGKGVMSTYFLCGHLDRMLTEPQDEFTELKVQGHSSENKTVDKLCELTLDSPCDMNKIGVDGNFISQEYTSYNKAQSSTSLVAESLREINIQSVGHITRTTSTDNLVRQNIHCQLFPKHNVVHSLEKPKSLQLAESKTIESEATSGKQNNSIINKERLHISLDSQILMNFSDCDSFTKTDLKATSNSSLESLPIPKYDADCKVNPSNDNSCVNNDDPNTVSQNSGELEHSQVLTNTKDDVDSSISVNLTKADTATLERLTTNRNDHKSNTPTAIRPIIDKGALNTRPTPLPCNPISKSETFPLPSSHNFRPPARSQSTGSQSNLTTAKADTRNKKGRKKHNSKLCLLA